MSHTPRVSYVVLSRNSAAYIERCLRSLDAQNVLPGGDEIRVVDNGSTDGTGEVLARFAGTRPWVHTITLDRNYGTTRSRNLAVARARGGYIAFVDSDAELPPGTIDRLIATANRSARAGIVAPRLNYPDGRLQKSVDVFPTIGRKIQRRLALRQMEAANGRRRASSRSTTRLRHAGSCPVRRWTQSVRSTRRSSTRRRTWITASGCGPPATACSTTVTRSRSTTRRRSRGRWCPGARRGVTWQGSPTCSASTGMVSVAPGSIIASAASGRFVCLCRQIGR